MSLLGRADFKDGRFEILEASVPVPPGDVSLATVRQTRHGLDITVPALRQHLRPANTPKTGDQKGQKDQSVDQGVVESVHSAQGVHRGQQPDQNNAAMPRPKPGKAESIATSEHLDVAFKVLAENMFSPFIYAYF